MIIQMMKQRTGGSDSYIIESLRGFDLFPQTAHVESCVRLLRVFEELSADARCFSVSQFFDDNRPFKLMLSGL
jgi:hypothetical protein